jgi:hypothetical protein
MVLALAGLGLASCSSGPSAKPTVAGGAKAGCSAAPGAEPDVATVPITVTSASGSKLVTVGVCIGTHGPYPFVVDTGSPTSAIDSHLATMLHLKSAPALPLGGIGCLASGPQVEVPASHVGAITLAGQDMVSADLSSWSGVSVDGVLGSDVFGRFEALKIDLPHKSLSLLGLEGPISLKHQLLEGRPGTQPPPQLLATAPAVTAPLTVVHAPGSISVYTAVTVAGQDNNSFVVDTGSPVSTIGDTLTSSLHLSSTGSGTPPGGIGCTSNVPTLAPTPVGVPQSIVKLSTLRSMALTGPQRVGIAGGLGLDYLGRNGIFIIDYAAGAMALAQG